MELKFRPLKPLQEIPASYKNEQGQLRRDALVSMMRSYLILSEEPIGTECLGLLWLWNEASKAQPWERAAALDELFLTEGGDGEFACAKGKQNMLMLKLAREHVGQIGNQTPFRARSMELLARSDEPADKELAKAYLTKWTQNVFSEPKIKREINKDDAYANKTPGHAEAVYDRYMERLGNDVQAAKKLAGELGAKTQENALELYGVLRKVVDTYSAYNLDLGRTTEGVLLAHLGRSNGAEVMAQAVYKSGKLLMSPEMLAAYAALKKRVTPVVNN